MPSRHRKPIRSNSNSASYGIKQEGGCEEKIAPFTDVRAAPPTPDATPSKTGCTPIKGEGDSNFEVVAGHDDEEGSRFDGSSSQDAGSGDEIDVFLSLRDEKYKEKITPYWEKLWGEGRKRDGPTPKDTAPKILDDLKAEMKKSGGKLYRMSHNNSGYEATDEVALIKIQNDLARGRQDYRKSIFFRGNSSSGREPDASDSEGEDDVAPALSLAGPAKCSASLTTICDCDLVLSFRDDKYKQSITQIVLAFVDGQSDHPLTTVVSDQVKKVRSAGGSIFKLAKQGGDNKYIEVDDEGAIKKITANVRHKLTDARKNGTRYVVVHKKNERYIDAIVRAAKALAKENISKLSAISKAEEIIEEFRNLGAIHFFKNAVDEDEIPCSEALEKMSKDIQAEARSLHTPSKLSQINGKKEGILSSTRKCRDTRKSSIHDTPREYMSYYVRDLLLHDHPEWTVNRKVINGLDSWVASCQRSSGPCKLVGLDEILDDAFLSGFYEEHVVETDDGRGILKHVGLLHDPESIFRDALRCERNCRKQMNMGCEDNHGASSPTRHVETLDSETHSQNLPARRSEVNTAHTVTKPPHHLGQRNEDIVLCLKDQKYRTIMYDYFKDMKKSSASSTNATEVGKLIFESLKIQLQESGGMFLKKKGVEFNPADEKEALRKITQDLIDRVRTESRRNDSKKAQEVGKCNKRNLSEYHEGVSARRKMQKLSHNNKMDKVQDSKGQQQENGEQRGGNTDSTARATFQTTGASCDSTHENEREERSAACISAQRSEKVPNNPIILLDVDDALPDSEPVTIKDEEADQSVDKSKRTDFGRSRAEIREIFKCVLQSFNRAEDENDAAGIDFFGHLKRFLELKASNKEFNLGNNAAIIAQAVECFKEDKKEMNSNPSVSFFKSCLIATINEAKKKFPLP